MLLLSCSHLSRGFDGGPLFEDRRLRAVRRRARRPRRPERRRQDHAAAHPRRARRRRTPARSACTPGPALGCCDRTPSSPPAARCSTRPSRAFDELLAAQDEMVARRRGAGRTPPTRPSARPLAARYDRLDELLRHHDAYTLDHKVEAVLGGLGFRAERLRPRRRHLQRRPAAPAPARQAAARRRRTSCCSTSRATTSTSTPTRWLENYLVQQPQAMLDRQPRPLLPRPGRHQDLRAARPADHRLPRQLQAVRAAARGAVRAAS